MAQSPALTARQLLKLSGPELDAHYRQGTAVGIPPGHVRGTAILAPGTSRNQVMALGTRGRLARQGFRRRRGHRGEPVLRGAHCPRTGLSRPKLARRGAPSLVLDYSQTSRIYVENRDEIRQVAPGLFLGLMYGKTQPQPTLRMYFALEVGP